MSDQQPPAQNLSPQHLLTLYEITGVMNASLEFDQALDNIIESVMKVTKAQRGFLMIADETQEELRVLVARGMDGKTIEEEGYSTTIVKQVVATQQPLLTNNAQFDTRYQAGQSIIMRGLRAILCAPMATKGRLVGVLYVDTSMRSGNFSQADRDLLSAVAGQAAIALENARLYTVAVEKGRLERELQMAREIQESLLPRQMPQVAHYQVAARWESAREVAGDFYDAFELGEDRFGVVIADVSDKGAPAALFMAVARTMIRAHSFAGLSAIDTVSRTNDLILDDADSGMFVTVYHSVFESNGRSVHVNAGHNPPIYYRAKAKELFFMSRGGRAVGWFPENPLHQTDMQLEPGDLLVYYTDGVTEAQSTKGEFFGEDRLAEIIQRCVDYSPQALIDEIVKAVDLFAKGMPPFDDQTLVIVRYTG
ncbi:MAG: SpoIIE family protein phosphatase [Anaerolineae bacterium]|jgi:sigma-B regulation protein RsbU (phosphoserine phosphatase)|nr:SpoIIE family protein phosphatase [Anaerolineae bacterium]